MAAQYLGVSPLTLYKSKKIVQAAREDSRLEPLISDVDGGNVSVDRAYFKVKQHQKVERIKRIEVPKTDIEILEKLGISIRPQDVWNFPKQDQRFGLEYPGQVSADIVFNTLYFFTEQGDLVVDPMAGRGLVGDVSYIMKRKCIMYDLHPFRQDIKKLDIMTESLPEECRNADLLFWDDPYFKIGSSAKKGRDEFLPFIRHKTDQFYDLGIKQIALVVSDLSYDNESKDLFSWHYTNAILSTAKWRVHRHIHCPLTKPQYDRVKENHRAYGVQHKEIFGQTTRSLVVFFREGINWNIIRR